MPSSRITRVLSALVTACVAAGVPSVGLCQAIDAPRMTASSSRVEFHAGAFIPITSLGEDAGYAARFRLAPLVGATIGLSRLGPSIVLELQVDASLGETRLEPTAACAFTTFTRCAPLSVSSALMDLGARVVRGHSFGTNSVFFGIGAGERIVANNDGECADLAGTFCLNRSPLSPVFAAWPSLSVAAGGVLGARFPLTSQLRATLTRVLGGKVSTDLMPTLGIRF